MDDLNFLELFCSFGREWDQDQEEPVETRAAPQVGTGKVDWLDRNVFNSMGLVRKLTLYCTSDSSIDLLID